MPASAPSASVGLNAARARSCLRLADEDRRVEALQFLALLFRDVLQPVELELASREHAQQLGAEALDGRRVDRRAWQRPASGALRSRFT